jgi:hypothetical protein
MKSQGHAPPKAGRQNGDSAKRLIVETGGYVPESTFILRFLVILK